MKFRFTAGFFVIALKALAQPVISPAPNTQAAPRTGAVTVTFGQPLAPGAANGLKVFSTQRGGLRTRGNTPVTVAGNTLRFAPTAFPFLPGELLQATITTAAPLVPARVFRFTAAAGGQGRGTFVAPASNADMAVGQQPGGIAFGDIDGNGTVDLLVANAYDNTVSIRSNDGAGNFAAVLPNIAVTNAPVGLALADIDGDGDLDVLTSGIGVISGGLMGSLVSIRKNDGTGHFTTPYDGTASVGSYASGLAVGDVDGDGDLDFVTSNASSSVSVRFNDGTGRFSASYSDFAAGYISFKVALGDLDNDGDLDIATNSTNDGTIRLNFNDGRGNFTTRNAVSAGVNPAGFLISDVDGDGDLDFVTANAGSSSLSVRLNDGRGNFTASASLPDIALGTPAYELVAGDVDADGDPDLVVISSPNTGPSFTTTLLNSGTGRFTPAGTTPLGIAANGLALADVDGDGDLDFAASIYRDNKVSVRLNGGTSPPPTLRISGPATICPGPAAAITLSATGTPAPASYLWSTGASSASIATSQPGTFTVTATFADGQTASAQQVVAAGVAAPAFLLGRDTTLCDGSEVLLQGPRGPGLSYLWSDGSTGAALRVSTAGTYSLQVKTACGEQQASRAISVRSCLNIPTIITANNDGMNDYFAPAGLAAGSWALEVYSRWGQRVYQKVAYTNEWGAGAAPGIYYYQLTPTASTGPVYRGWVEVVR